MPVVLTHLKERLGVFRKPVMKLWLLAGLGLATLVLAGWGLLRITSLSVELENHDDRLMATSVALKEQVAAYSKLTYDFLLQQDFSRMMVKEKQSDTARAEIEQGLAQLGAINRESDIHDTIEAIRTNVMQFLVLTDKALETAAEDGSALKARSVLQDEVEPAFKKADASLNKLIYSRQQFDLSRFHHMRQQALMIIALLLGLTTLGISLLLGLKRHIKPDQNLPAVKAPLPQVDNYALAYTPVQQMEMHDHEVEARSLAALAFANRLSRVRKESDDLKKLMTGLHSFVAGAELIRSDGRGAADQDIDTLTRQGDKIGHAVSRIQHVHEQSRQFIEKLNDIMNGMQKLATEGNVVSLNVTIELAKLQAQQGGVVDEDKNTKISEQIRGLATSAASITGKLAMVVSQFRYAQEDFSRHTSELADLKLAGAGSLDRLRSILQNNGQSATRLSGQRDELANYLPILERKMMELESQITQLQAIYDSEVEASADGITPRSFKVISGRAA